MFDIELGHAAEGKILLGGDEEYDSQPVNWEEYFQDTERALKPVGILQASSELLATAALARILKDDKLKAKVRKRFDREGVQLKRTLCTSERRYDLRDVYPFESAFSNASTYGSRIYLRMNPVEFPCEIFYHGLEFYQEEGSHLILWEGDQIFLNRVARHDYRPNTLAFLSAVSESDEKLGVLILDIS